MKCAESDVGYFEVRAVFSGQQSYCKLNLDVAQTARRTEELKAQVLITRMRGSAIRSVRSQW